MKERPDAKNQHAPASDDLPDTRPVQFESDRYERNAGPRPYDLGGSSTLPPPQSVINEKYRIDAELGRGGMGAVYRAHHVELLKPVALKWLLPEFAEDPASRQRFAREARAASNIKHENVVDVYDFGIDVERGVPYIVMELLSGASLGAYLEQRGRLDATEALAIMIPCMRGVAAAHKLGIVHRDLKPENIYLCESDDPEIKRVKVLDFGVAAALEPRSDEAFNPIITRTASRNIVGTVFYMPAEQLVGGTVDARADVYSLGVILYELLSGTPPYYGETINDVTTAILDGNAAPLTSQVAGLDPALAELVHRAMAPRKVERFADLAEMIQAFQQYARRDRSGTMRRSLTDAGHLVRERSERASRDVMRAVTAGWTSVRAWSVRVWQLLAAGMRQAGAWVRGLGAQLAAACSRLVQRVTQAGSGAWSALERRDRRAWATVATIGTALACLLSWAAWNARGPRGEQLPQVVPQAAQPRVPLRPVEPAPVTVPIPDTEESTSAATDPAVEVTLPQPPEDRRGDPATTEAAKVVEEAPPSEVIRQPPKRSKAPKRPVASGGRTSTQAQPPKTANQAPVTKPNETQPARPPATGKHPLKPQYERWRE